MSGNLREQIYRNIPGVLPFLSGFLVLRLPEDKIFGISILEKFLIALFVFVSWRGMRQLIYVLKLKHKVLVTDYLTLLFFAVFTPVLLQVLRSRIETDEMHIVLTTMLAAGLSDFYAIRKLAFLAVMSRAIYIFGGAVLSFMFFTLFPEGPILVFCTAVSCMLLAQYLAYLYFENSLDLRDWSLVFRLCLVFGPVIVVGMVCFGRLPQFFSLTLFPLVFSGNLISRLSAGDPNLSRREAFMEVSSISHLFVVIMLLVNLLF